MRNAVVADLLAHWEREVGEIPFRLKGTLSNWAQTVPAEVIRQAIDTAAADDLLEDSEAVCDRVHKLCFVWRRDNNPKKRRA